MCVCVGGHKTRKGITKGEKFRRDVGNRVREQTHGTEKQTGALMRGRELAGGEEETKRGMDEN